MRLTDERLDRRSLLRTAILAAGASIASLVASRGDAGARGAPADVAGKPGGTTGSSEEEIAFTSGPDTLYGSLLIPAGTDGQRRPAALLIAGSGPVDRNGNEPALGLPNMNTLLNFADALAGLGVVSLRYDKIGSGRTGIGSFAADPASIDFETFVASARAAYDYLAARPEVDPARILILGHSEGGLIALVLTSRLDPPVSPAALVLAAPLGVRYLDLLRRQIENQVQGALAQGQISQDAATASLDQLNAAIDGLRSNGEVPASVTIPGIRQLFAPNARFLADADRYDPQQIAASLPPSLPVLILRGEKDQQVDASDVDGLLAAFQSAGNTSAQLWELPDVDHVFKVVPGTPNPAVDYNNPDLPFPPEAADRLAAFVRQYLAA